MTNAAQSLNTYCYKCGAFTSMNEDEYPVCPKHGTLWPLRRNSVCAESFVVNENGKILLIKRAGEPLVGSWALSGGFSHYGEHPSQTAVREVLEETGWKVRLTGEILGVYIDSFPQDPNSEHRVVVSYLAQPVEDTKGELDGETDGHDWFDLDSLPSPMVEVQLNRFNDYKKLATG